jgi:hypothetical protein
MPTIGPNFVGATATVQLSNTTDWTNPANFQGDTTGTAATCNIGTNGGTSWVLQASGFNFASIPSGSSIDEIQVEVENSAANANRHYWDTLQLWTGAIFGNNVSTGAAISTTKAFDTFSGDSTYWGGMPTRDQVASTSFGIRIRILRNASQSTTTSMFRARITVTYTESGGAVQTVTSYVGGGYYG